MKCYDFELNLTAYIEGEIKEKNRQLFLTHKEECDECNGKLNDIIKLIEVMPQVKTYKTTSNFMDVLNKKIFALDNKESSIWKKIQGFKPLGYSPAPSVGFVLSLTVIIIASYFLFNNDEIPKINVDKFSDQSKKANPSITMSPQKIPIMADSDSTEKKDVKNRYDGKIKLVRGK